MRERIVQLMVDGAHGDRGLIVPRAAMVEFVVGLVNATIPLHNLEAPNVKEVIMKLRNVKKIHVLVSSPGEFNLKERLFLSQISISRMIVM